VSEEEPGQFPSEFDWSWSREASIRELSAHGREVQARRSAGPPQPPRRLSWAKRLRFRLYLVLGRRGRAQRRRNFGSDNAGGR
jgi:hypothetical protein